MISEHAVLEIQRLLSLGNLSQQKIANLMNVSRGSVNAIACGKRMLTSPLHSPPILYDKAQNRCQHIDMPDGPFQRCPSCGAYVRTPCLACQIREALLK